METKRTVELRLVKLKNKERQLQSTVIYFDKKIKVLENKKKQYAIAVEQLKRDIKDIEFQLKNTKEK